MGTFLKYTFGGLSAQYYFRQFIFGCLMAGLIIWVAAQSKTGLSITPVFVMVVNAMLYPYARFVYESAIGFIMGDNVFHVNALFMLIVKFFTMAMCFSFAIFIAPIGLVYLYFFHRKNAGLAR